MLLQLPTDRRAPPGPSDRVLLEGPHSRRKELWLVLRALRDFIAGFRTLHFVGPCVTVFGSARFDESHPYYALGREIGAALAGLGFTVMTGGGPGLMEAANRGAREAGGRSSFPVVLVGKEYWRPFQNLLEHLALAGTIDRADLDRLLVTDRVTDVVAHIERYAVRRFGLVRPSPLLGERAVTSLPPRRSRAA
jgi:predicted Rossmann-fold nucleotide-binding protein